MSDDAASTLGEKLAQGVRNLWTDVNSQRKVLNHYGQEIEALRARMNSLESQIRGLKSTKGKALASNKQLKASLTEAENKLQQISNALN